MFIICVINILFEYMSSLYCLIPCELSNLKKTQIDQGLIHINFVLKIQNTTKILTSKVELQPGSVSLLTPTHFYFMWQCVCILFQSLHVLIPYVFFCLREDTLLSMLGIGHAPKLWLWHFPLMTKFTNKIFSLP
jgi:hypothetical protein